MAEKLKILEALKELRAEEKRKFVQTVDLIINLQNFDARKESVNTFVQIPFPTPKNICGFLTRRIPIIDTILKDDFDKFKTDSDIKRLANKYDFFIAAAPMMGTLATKFGRVFGPIGKMPSPQAGIIALDSDQNIKDVVEKMKKLIRIRSKEKSLKIPVGKEDMDDEKLKSNIEAIVSTIEKLLPRKNDNIKNIMIKFTMTKPVKILDKSVGGVEQK